jgi:hypothetical protein
VEFENYKDLVPIEDKVKASFGFIFNKNDINNIDLIINNSILNFKNKDKEIQNFLNENFYNFGRTTINLEKLLNIID